MNSIGQMLQTHPQRMAGSMPELTHCIEACYDCAAACNSCADACLGEENLQMLVRCIRLNMDCADVCTTTGRMLQRQTQADWTLLRAQVQVCVEACRACGDECAKHASHHEHCDVCADSCRACEQACNALLSALPG